MNAKNKSDEEMVSWLALNIVKTFYLFFKQSLFILLTNGFRFKQSSKYKQNKCSFSIWLNTDLYVCMCNIHTPVDLKGPEPRVFRELTCQSPGRYSRCDRLVEICQLLSGCRDSTPTVFCWQGFQRRLQPHTECLSTTNTQSQCLTITAKQLWQKHLFCLLTRVQSATGLDVWGLQSMDVI